MAFSSTFSHNSLSCFSSSFPQTPRPSPFRFTSIRAVKSAEPDKEKLAKSNTQQDSSNAQPPTTAPKYPKKPVYSSEYLWASVFSLVLKLMVGWVLIFQFWFVIWAVKKGQIVRVDKEKYLNSINVSWLDQCLEEMACCLFNLRKEGEVPLDLCLYKISDSFIHLKILGFKFQYLSVGHPPYYKGLDYIYEDRGEVRIQNWELRQEGRHSPFQVYYTF